MLTHLPCTRTPAEALEKLRSISTDLELLVQFEPETMPVDRSKMEHGESLRRMSGPALTTHDLTMAKRRDQDWGFTTDAASTRGVQVADVDAGSPAARAGLRAGDRIVQIAGTLCQFSSPAVVNKLLADSGDGFTMTVHREGAAAAASAANATAAANAATVATAAAPLTTAGPSAALAVQAKPALVTASLTRPTTHGPFGLTLGSTGG